MAKKNNIPEVDIVVDEAAGVIREVKTEKHLRSKKGHERRVNAMIYVILIVMSIVWLCPFVFLTLQSFRGESGGQVAYVIPKPWTLDNYKFLFEGVRYDPMMLFKDSGATMLSLLMIGGCIGLAGMFAGERKFGYITIGLSALCLLIDPAWDIQIQLLCMVALAGVGKLLWTADVKKTSLVVAAAFGVLSLRYLITMPFGALVAWAAALAIVGGALYLANRLIERPNLKISAGIMAVMALVLAMRSIDSSNCDFVR